MGSEPIGSAKEEWSIIKKLSDEFSFVFEPNTFEQLRSELLIKYTKLSNLNEILVSDSPDKLVEMIVSHERQSDDNWTHRLGL